MKLLLTYTSLKYGIFCSALQLSDDGKLSTRDDVNDATADMSHESLLLTADYSCFGGETAGLSPPEVDHSTWSFKSDTVDGRPRLYVKYVCNDGSVLKDNHNSHLYCKNGRWIGKRPVCVTGELKELP
jgi:Sushi repeat (SCR repeat)